MLVDFEQQGARKFFFRSVDRRKATLLLIALSILWVTRIAVQTYFEVGQMGAARGINYIIVQYNFVIKFLDLFE